DVVQSELLTPKGLRTLSPKSELYIGIYQGNQEERDRAYHQGTVCPWLIGHFCQAYLKVHKNSGLHLVKNLYLGFEEEMTNGGIGTIAEIYDGDPPHEAKGAVSQAWSVAELLRLKTIIDKFEASNN
ncbi:MAG: amylo-alpha-1,6-glucosidase, partial [Chloroflexia bacterium]|nr:amylo-alpha-1,6-glucosidase [Chloroflexia bacterium]